MKYNLAFKYRIYPNKEQELLINKTFGCVRFVYNTIFSSFFINFISSIQERIVDKTNTSKSLFYQ